MFFQIETKLYYINSVELLNIIARDLEKYVNPESPWVEAHQGLLLGMKVPYRTFVQKDLLEYCAEILGIGAKNWRTLKPDKHEDMLYTAFQHLTTAVGVIMESSSVGLREGATVPDYAQELLADIPVIGLSITGATVAGKVLYDANESDKQPATG